jgi:hypothetical protein
LLLHLAGLRDGLLGGVADASPAKHGCRMLGSAILLIAPEQLVAGGPGAVLLFVSDLLREARRALPEIEASGARWIDVGTGVVSGLGRGRVLARHWA